MGRSGPMWNCAEVATEYLPWLLQVACVGCVAYRSDLFLALRGNRALAEGFTTPLSRGYSGSKPEVCTGPSVRASSPARTRPPQFRITSSMEMGLLLRKFYLDRFMMRAPGALRISPINLQAPRMERRPG
jgi:hypothetical protein